MKRVILNTWLTGLSLLMTQGVMSAQGLYSSEKFAVVEVDISGLGISPQTAGGLLLMELQKLNTYKVIDAYDMKYLMTNNELELTDCYSTYCLKKVGELLNVDKILTGTISRAGSNIDVTIKAYDVKSGAWGRISSHSYNNVPEQLSSMIALTLRQMLEIKHDEDLFRRLTSEVSFYANAELAKRKEANLSGPRIGVGFLAGEVGELMKTPKKDGGLGGIPVVSHLGFQFEKVFISSGNTHALVEILPTLSGLEQGRFIPGINILLGVRNGRTGLEAGLGYNMQIGKIERDEAQRAKVLTELSTGLLVVVGKSFKSGRLNIPVNLYFIPGPQGSHRFGVTFGFNMSRL